MPPNRKKHPTTTKELLRYCTPKLIKLLEGKRLLWDTTDPNFYNLPERAENWRDLTRQILSNFDECDESAQKRMVQQIKTRWRHVRTAYVRQKKMPNQKKSYLYDKEMAFYSSHGRGIFSNFSGKNDKASKKPLTDEYFDSNDDVDELFSEEDIDYDEPKAKNRRIEQPSKGNSEKANDNSHQENSADEIFQDILVQEESNPTETDDDDESFSFMYEYDDEQEEPIEINNKLNISTESAVHTDTVKLETFPPMEQNSSIADEDCSEEIDQNKSDVIHSIVQASDEAHYMHQAEKFDVKPHHSRKNTVKQKRKKRYHENVSYIDDDQCFFDSIKPALRDLNEDDKMDFRIEVMSILRDLKKKKQN